MAPPVGRGWEYTDRAGLGLGRRARDAPRAAGREGGGALGGSRAPTTSSSTPPTCGSPSTSRSDTPPSSTGPSGTRRPTPGTSFATFDKLGTLQYGSPVMHVIGDRTTPHGLATVGYDDEGVAAQSFDIVRDGVLVGLPARPAHGGRERLRPFQRLRLRRLAVARAHPAHGQRVAPARAGTRARTEHRGAASSGVERGIYVVGDKSWSIDMQRYNFQFTGQRFYRIENGRLAGQCKDVAYQAQTTEFWGSLEAVGRPLHLRARGRLQLRQGPARAGGAGQPRLPVRPVPRHQRPQRPGRGRGMSAARPMSGRADERTRRRPP